MQQEISSYWLKKRKKNTKHCWWKPSLTWKLHHWFSNIHIFSQVVFSGASWVIECKAFHLVCVCQRWVWEPGPLNVVSAGPLIEPDQFTETTSRLAQLPHQRDSNNCTLWPLPTLKKAIFMFASKQASEHSENAGHRYSLSSLQLPHKAILVQFRNKTGAICTYINTTTPNCTLIRSLFAVSVETNKKKKHMEKKQNSQMTDRNFQKETAIIPK